MTVFNHYCEELGVRVVCLNPLGGTEPAGWIVPVCTLLVTFVNNSSTLSTGVSSLEGDSGDLVLVVHVIGGLRSTSRELGEAEWESKLSY